MGYKTLSENADHRPDGKNRLGWLSTDGRSYIFIPGNMTRADGHIEWEMFKRHSIEDMDVKAMRKWAVRLTKFAIELNAEAAKYG